MLFSLVTGALYSRAALDTTSSPSFPSLQEEEKASAQLADTLSASCKHLVPPVPQIYSFQ